MKEDRYIVNKLRKAKLQEVPETFFHTFFDELWHLIELEDQTDDLLGRLSLNRFENDLKTIKNLDIKDFSSNESNTVTLPSKRVESKQIFLWLGAVAASLILFFTWPSLNGSNDDLAANQSTEEVILAYLDEDDLVDYLVDLNLDHIQETGLEEEVLFEALEDEIYDYINDI